MEKCFSPVGDPNRLPGPIDTNKGFDFAKKGLPPARRIFVRNVEDVLAAQWRFLVGIRKEAMLMNDVFETEEAECLGAWCRVGSIVRSDFYINEADERRTVSRVLPYPGTHENGMVWTDDVGLHSLEGVDFKDWIRPLASGLQKPKIFG